MQADALNLGGAKLYDNVQRALATRFGIPASQADIALDFMPATEGQPVYTVTGSNDDFPYRRWITQRDEKVCKICGPRHGQIYHLFDTYEIWPAHPNCRCYLQKLNLGGAFAEMQASCVGRADGHCLRALFGGVYQGLERRRPQGLARVHESTKWLERASKFESAIARERASAFESTMSGERANIRKGTKVGERASDGESTTRPERLAISGESTSILERAMRDESTNVTERATRSESTRDRERAIQSESTTGYERASSGESTKVSERAK